MKKISLIILALLITIAPYNASAKQLDVNGFLKKLSLAFAKTKTKMNSLVKTKGTIFVTPDRYKNILYLGHSGIVYDSRTLIEANTDGVVRSSNNWDKTKKEYYALRVRNLNQDGHNKAANYANKMVGKKYNWIYTDTKTRDKFYCSQLVWASFYDTLKINLDTDNLGKAPNFLAMIHPMELVESPNTSVIYYHANK